MERVTGVDVARGLAVLGMFTAHVGPGGADFWSGTGWTQVVDGRSAATFALLAGVSAALLSGGSAPVGAPGLRRSRDRILVRAALLLALGALMVALRTPVAVILPGYALMFALSAGALTWPRRVLLFAAGAVALVGSLVVHALRLGLVSEPFSPAMPHPASLVVGEHYPAAVWMAYLLVGIAVGRSDLRAPRTAGLLVAAGAGCAVLGYGAAAVALRALDPSSTWWRAVLTSAPHTDTAPEVLGNTGVALGVIGLSLVTARRGPTLVRPLAATGALALTAYCGHLVAIAVLGNGVVRSPTAAGLAAFIVVTLVVTTAWRTMIGRGPLEWLFHGISTAVADRRAPIAPDHVPETPGRRL